MLSEISASMRDDHVRGDHWEGSAFEWLLTLPPGTKGAVGRQMVAAWAERTGLAVGMSGLRLEINGLSVAVKMSMLWEGFDFKFQQIRDEQYDQILFLGIAPSDVYAWFIPKQLVLNQLRGRSGQHTGKGSTETFWETVRPEAPPNWMFPYGDSLSHVRDLIIDQTA